ncbi:MAG: pyridoxal-phosphate dependent enzyme [Clostridiales bacterium]|nr:pyridoxal-phosphate dependent enzyme [Clostridiales bacterium]
MKLPLFERFPGIAALPRVELCDLPTPVANGADILPLDEDAEEIWPVHGLWVKRDDLTNAIYGGNKVRKLEFLLGQAKAQGRAAVLTFGAYGSNHALATAVHARALGLEPHVVLSPQAPGPFAAATLRAHAALGTVIHPIDGWDGRREAVLARRGLARRDGVEPYVIPMGGTNSLGTIGYVNAAFEVAAQVRELDLGAIAFALGDFVAPDVVYVAGGTLGTAVGLAIGFAALERAGARMAPQVLAIRVTPGEVANEPFAEKLAAETIMLMRSLDSAFPELTFADLRLELRHEFFDPGYGVPTSESIEAVKLAGAAGVKLETTYTGKAFAALMADTKSGRLQGARDHVLFWDTYHSGPMPPAGPVEALPPPLQAYVAECDRLFGAPAGG